MWEAGGVLVAHEAVYPPESQKAMLRQWGGLATLKKSGQHRCKFLCTFEAQTHRGRYQGAVSRDTRKMLRVASTWGKNLACRGRPQVLWGSGAMPCGMRGRCAGTGVRWDWGSPEEVQQSKEAEMWQGGIKVRRSAGQRWRRPGRCEEAGARAGPGGGARGELARAGGGGGRGSGGGPFAPCLCRRRGSRRRSRRGREPGGPPPPGRVVSHLRRG